MYFFKTLFYIALSMMAAMIGFLYFLGMIQLFGFLMLSFATAALVWTALSYGKFIPFRIENGMTYRLIGHTNNLLFLKKEFDGDVPMAVNLPTDYSTPPVIKNFHIHTQHTAVYYGRILNRRESKLRTGDLCTGIRGRNKKRDGVVEIEKN